MPYGDVLLGLRAMILEGREGTDRGALLARRSPGLAAAERAVLLAMAPERVDVYAGLVRDGQATMLRFVAPTVLEVAERFAGVPAAALARATLVETPRRTASLRELSARLVEHLGGAGAALRDACPAILDLARLEQQLTEAFYAPDDAEALDPAGFAAAVADVTVDDALRFEARPSASLRVVALDHDVVGWRDQRYAEEAWPPAPSRLDAPIEALVARDPVALQPRAHLVPAAVVDWVRAGGDRAWRPLEAWAEGWLTATGTAPDDPEAAARFFEQVAAFVRAGVLAVRVPGSSRGSDRA